MTAADPAIDRAPLSASVRARLARGAAWLGAARLLVNMLQAVRVLVLTRLLAPSDVGLVVIAMTTLSILNSLTFVPLSSALIQRRDVTDEHLHTTWTYGAGRGLLIAAVLAIAAYPIAMFYHDPRLIGIMGVLAVGAIVDGLQNPRPTLLTKRVVFWQQFMLDVPAKAISIFISIALAAAFRSYWALVLGSLAGGLVTLTISYCIMPFRPRVMLTRGRDLLSFSIWLSFGQIVTQLNWSSDQLLVGAVLGSSALGNYAVGNMVAMVVTREATAPLASTLFPAFSTFNDDRDRLVNAYLSAFGFLVAAALPVGVGTAIVADSVVHLVMGDKWLASVPVIRVLAPVFAIQTAGSLAQPLGMALGTTRLLFIRDFQGFLMRVPLVTAGLLLFGMPGALVSRVISGLALILLDLNVVRRATGLRLLPQMARVWRSFVSAAAMCGALLLIDGVMRPMPGFERDVVRLAVLSAAGLVTYLGVHAAVWLACGRPVGPEREAAQFVHAVRRRFARAG